VHHHASVAICGILLVATATAAPVCPSEPCRVTLRGLIENPESLQGKRVRVDGVLDLRFESHSLRHGDLRLALNLFRPIDDEDLAKNMRKVEAQVEEDWARIEKWQRAGLQGRWVEVIGVFDTAVTGHFDMLKHGGLRDVEAIVPRGIQ
jgi:hypothetical protein